MEFVSAEGAVWAWLREAGIDAYMSVPESGLVFPSVLIQRVGGTMGYDLDQPRIQFDCFALNKADADALARRVAAMLANLRGRRGSALTGADIESMFPQGQASDPYRRYVVDATVYVRTKNA